MRLDDVKYFLAVAKLGLLHKAADELGISQPALTKAIHRMEESLGVQLFRRTPKGMTLSEHGQIFHSSALRLKREFDNASHLLDEAKAGANAKVRVGVTPANEDLVNTAFLRLLRTRPALKLQTKVQLSDALLSLLHNGEVSFIVAPIPDSVPDDVEVQLLREETFYIISRHDHRLQQLGRRVKAKDLEHESWILPPKSVFARQQIDVIYSRAHISGPNVQVDTDYSSPIGPYSLVAQSDLLGLCTPTGRHLAESFEAAVVNLEGSLLYRRVGIFTLRDIELSPLTQSFIEAVVAVVDETRVPR